MNYFFYFFLRSSYRLITITDVKESYNSYTKCIWNKAQPTPGSSSVFVTSKRDFISLSFYLLMFLTRSQLSFSFLSFFSFSGMSFLRKPFSVISLCPRILSKVRWVSWQAHFFSAKLNSLRKLSGMNLRFLKSFFSRLQMV